MKRKVKLKSITPKFVDLIPEVIARGILYISIPYATATHSCACGCEARVTTPIRRNFWVLTWNGEEVSLKPSIGNFNEPCKSHYWIAENKIVWVNDMWNYPKMKHAIRRESRSNPSFDRLENNPMDKEPRQPD